MRRISIYLNFLSVVVHVLQASPIGQYLCSVTGEKALDSKAVSVVVHGDRGSSRIFHFLAGRQPSWKEGRETLNLKWTEVGTVDFIRIQHLTSKPPCVWQPTSAEVNYGSRMNQTLSCRPPSARFRREVSRQMDVTVTTVDEWLAGTDAVVYIQLIGKTGTSPQITVPGAYEAGDTDRGSINVGNIGIITRLKMGHDNGGFQAGWKPEEVVLNEDGEGVYTFVFNQWIADPVLSLERDIQSAVCTDMLYCTSQRCVTCDECYNSDRTYYYARKSDRKECFRCSPIDKCEVEECPSTDGQTCSRCEGVVSDSPGLRAYIPAADKQTCLQACSWRADSKWCYPGVCTDEFAANCECSEGFTGDNCQTITEKPQILWNHLLFSRVETDTAEAPLDPNTGTEQEKSWTNLKDIQKVKVDFKSKYIQSGTVPTRHPYIEDYKVGITAGTISYRFFRGGSEMTARQTSRDCGGVSSSAPSQQLYNCLQEFNISDLAPAPLMTDDVLQFQFVTENGGSVSVRDKENGALTPHVYTGKSTSVTVKMGIDYVDPYHCIATSCRDSMLTVTGISLEATLTVSWKGWLDDSSGLHHYEIMVFEMEYIVSVGGLRNKRLELMKEYNSSLQQADVTLGEKGIFSVELSAYDKAGNYKNSRRIVIYDKDSEVTTVHGTVLRVTSAAATAAWEWQWTSDSVSIDWKSRYINVLHHEKKWLDVVTASSDVDSVYDDNGYARGIDAITNVQGIIEFKTAFKKDHSGGTTITTTPDDAEFTTLDQSEKHIITPFLEDGDTLRYWIRAYDIMGSYFEESVTVHIDTSPPIIKNLWLTRGDRLNVAVHRIEELSTMTIEWESYDEHSGLETVSWRLYDNFTNTDIVHGIQHITAQGDAIDIPTCVSKYNSYPRGSNCYSTPGVGSYHRHFQVKPLIVADHLSHGGVFQSKDKGVHDVDYFLEVTVMNHAHLTTTLDFKVTVDASPPHRGFVYDGQKGNPEVDYQSTLQFYAHWDGFFDKESGVKFYQYGFADHCLQESDFALDLSSVQVTETFSTHASWSATSPGKFYITVVAYNRALEPSSPVCSDGVTVDQTGPVLTQMAVLNSHTTEGLVKTGNGEVWLISQDRRRSNVEEPDSTCTQDAMLISEDDLRLLPIQKFPNETDVTYVSTVCSEYKSFSLAGVNIFYLSKDQMLYVNWTCSDDESGTYDYELGLMSDPSNVEAPNIQIYTSTNNHPHYQGYHPALSEGQQFFIAVRAINRAAVTSTEILGPVTVHTQPPSFTGPIGVVLQDTFLVASWDASAFSDPVQNYLHYQFAVGSTPRSADVLPYRSIQTGGGCSSSTPPSCTAIDISDLHWDLHHSHTYYFSLKVDNIVGLFTVGVSDPYTHDARVPSLGVVLDVSPPEERQLFDITEFEDTDFQLSTTTLDARWYGFDDDLDGVTYKACIGTGAGLEDVRAYEDVGGVLSHQFQSLSLEVNKMYFVTIIAITSAGNNNQTSDGVTVIQNNTSLVGISVRDGENCTSAPGCGEDILYQTSTSTYSAHWTTNMQQKQQYQDAYISLEKKDPLSGAMWTESRDYENHGLIQHATLGGLFLEPGHTYRAAVKFCAFKVCTNPVYSDGVTVIPHPPVSGGISVTYKEIGAQSQIDVRLDRYRDPDIPGLGDSYDVMDRYEWSLPDNSHSASLLIHWTPVSNPVTDGDQVTFTIDLSKHLSFKKCHRVAVRGYNKMSLHTIVSTDIKDCRASDPVLIVPALIIDAFGSNAGREDQGKDITLDENAIWEVLDADYTPYKNVLSAVWPSLRQHNYTWAVVSGDSVDPVFHYKRENLMTVSDPCTLPNVVKCGKTDKEYINVDFEETEYLSHGKRYYICIHADETPVEYEKWPDVLREVNECSDGVTVDLTPPSGGTVTVEGLKEGLYQVSRSEVTVSWKDFTDVEESGPTPHPSGISYYQLALGSVPGGEDILAMTNVGLVHRSTVPRLTLFDGQSVYATVIATDFVNKTRKVSSPGAVIDSSPPQKTSRQIQFEGRYVMSPIIYVCWEGVLHDAESGIKYFEVSFSSRPGQADIVPLTEVGDVCGWFDTDSKLQDGHSFYISVKAFNHAGLSRTVSSHSFLVDTTPPSLGRVFDGKIDAADSSNDKDYVTNIEDMGAHWEGFSDPQSPVSLYRVKVGSCSGCDDIVAEYEAAARSDVVFADRHILFEEGITYYVTVTACNKAGLCSSATSDGVILDQSPPVPGRVMDGTQDRDIQYQATGTFLGCKWHGFRDAESGLDYYEWWVGTSPEGQEILSPMHAALEEVAFHILPTSGQLPVGQKIFITVRAYNMAGLFTESTSNGFVVDDTAPVVEKSPTIAEGQGSLVAMTLMSRTTIRISWEMKDEESFIEKQYISILSHQLGEFDSSLLKLPGLLREFTFTKLDLHDGCRYKVMVTACNMAGLCNTSDTGDILVDGSKPLTGTLAVQTDHSAQLLRHQSNGMTWTGTSLNLAWLGFNDLHSGIDHYIVTVGSTPFAADLANNELPVIIAHDATGVDKEDEGVVQVFAVNTRDISSLLSVFVAIWAVNGVGLKSIPHHSELILEGGGQLELVRRCTPYNCEGQCVCAIQDKNCGLRTGCTKLNRGGGNSVLTVNDVISLTSVDPDTSVDVDFSPSDTFLAATWRVTNIQGQQPARYEFSVGETEFDIPKGIYNEALDRVWFDAGTSQFAVVVLEKGTGRELTPGLKYSVFVRAWYNQNTYSVFKSDGVLVDNSRPTFTDKVGMAVKEHKTDTSEKDIDFQPFTDTMFISWDGKFLPGDSGLQKYRVYVCTSPGGHSIHSSADVAAKSYKATGLSLEAGTVYFSNILAYNKAGLVGWTYSDGVLPDTVKPVTGIVQDGTNIFDTDYQSSPTDISASWFGFSDTHSTIVKYFWCVGTTSDAQDSSLMAWQDVGLHTSADTKLTLQTSGTKLWTKVYAVDAAGNVSPVAVSDGVVIDASEPNIQKVVYLGDNLVSNPSFEEDEGTKESTDVACNHMIPKSWTVGTNSCVKVLTPNDPNSKHRNNHITVSGSIHQNVTGLVPGMTYLLTLHTGYPEFLTVNHKAVEGSVSIGREMFTFSLDPRLCKGVCQVKGQSSILWSTHKYKFMAEESLANLSIATASRNMEVVVDYVTVQLVENSGDDGTMETQQHLMLHPVFLPHWSSVHASWYFNDDNSPIIEYTWAAGTVPGGTQIQKFVSVGRHSHGTLTGLTLTHKQKLYLTITARNAVGLTTVSHPDPITVDMTPPVFSLIIDGTGDTDKSDIDHQVVGDVFVTWAVTDEESGVHHCDWGIGKTPGGSDLKTFQQVAEDDRSAKFNITDTLNTTSLQVFITVRCFNLVGHMATATTDGVTVIRVDSPPTVQGLRVLKDKVPYLYGRGNCQSSKDVRLQWARDELQSIEIEITDDATTSKQVVQSQYQFATLTGLKVRNITTYDMNIFPKPVTGVTGHIARINFTMHGNPPTLSDTEIIKVTRKDNVYTLSWTGVFVSAWKDLLYAVHVGTVKGGADISKRNLRREEEIQLRLTVHRKTIAYISVTAVDPCGLTCHIQQTFNIYP